jgi:Rrf2 family protein
MSRSTKLASAAFIMSFVACKAPRQVTTDQIADALQDHPARVRQLVASLVKAELLSSLRGAAGGVVLGRSPAQISLRDIFVAVEDQPMLVIGLKEDPEGWGKRCLVYPILSRLFAEMEETLLDKLAAIPLTALYKT